MEITPGHIRPSRTAGVRTQDNLKRFQRVPVPGSSLSPDELTAAVNRLEALIADNGRRMHEAGGKGIERLPGARELLDALRKGNARWGICTSGPLPPRPCRPGLDRLHPPRSYRTATRLYADSALKTGEIGASPPALPFLVTADDVTHGKPHPEPYLRGMDGGSLGA